VIINIYDIIQDAIDLDNVNITIPSPFNISNVLPNFNYSILDDLNITLPNNTLFGGDDGKLNLT